MPEKPSYLGLLNAVANAECRGHAYLTAWADCTPDPDVRAVLLTIAREGEHGFSFAKRINELGFELIPTDDPTFDEKMQIATSDCSDFDKLEALGILKFATAGDEPDVFDNFFRDHTIDIRTGELLGRYIAEERDTLRLLQGCCAELTARNAASNRPDADRLTSLEDKIDAVCRGVEELRQIVCAQTMPTTAA